jgi:succinate dehydrogenase / fumarate reductase cytochrome b subunit
MKLFKLRYVDETFKNWHSGMLSFLAQRITGLLLVLYLLLHLVSLSSIGGGPDTFKASMKAYDTPFFRLMEWLLLMAVLFHMLNGLRIMAADWFGLTRLQRGMFWTVAIATIAACLASIPYFLLWR